MKQLVIIIISSLLGVNLSSAELVSCDIHEVSVVFSTSDDSYVLGKDGVVINNNEGLTSAVLELKSLDLISKSASLSGLRAASVDFNDTAAPSNASTMLYLRPLQVGISHKLTITITNIVFSENGEYINGITRVAEDLFLDPNGVKDTPNVTFTDDSITIVYEYPDDDIGQWADYDKFDSFQIMTSVSNPLHDIAVSKGLEDLTSGQTEIDLGLIAIGQTTDFKLKVSNAGTGTLQLVGSAEGEEPVELPWSNTSSSTDDFELSLPADEINQSTQITEGDENAVTYTFKITPNKAGVNGITSVSKPISGELTLKNDDSDESESPFVIPFKATAYLDADLDADPPITSGLDSDGDGLSNYFELTTVHINGKTDPLSEHSDDDGISDGEEVNTYAFLGLDPTEDDSSKITEFRTKFGLVAKLVAAEASSEGETVAGAFNNMVSVDSFEAYLKSYVQANSGTLGLGLTIAPNGTGEFTLQIELKESSDLKSWTGIGYNIDTTTGKLEFSSGSKFKFYRIEYR